MTDTELARRLEKLERDNRRLKRSLLGVLVLLAALAGIHATRPVPDVIKAHSFEAVDGSGRVRATISASPMVTLYDLHGLPQAEIGYGESYGPMVLLGMHRTSQPHGGEYGVDMSIRDEPSDGPAILLTGGPQNAMVGLNVSRSGLPNITLKDTQGFSTQFGSAGTINKTTGATQQTSAASIVMFDNDKEHRAIWKAP
jgi:hypothetical protein